MTRRSFFALVTAGLAWMGLSKRGEAEQVHTLMYATNGQRTVCLGELTDENYQRALAEVGKRPAWVLYTEQATVMTDAQFRVLARRVRGREWTV